MKTREQLNRRSFIRNTVAGATITTAVFPQIVSAATLGRGGAVSPNKKIGVALISCGPQGRGDMNGALAVADARVLAVCDVWTDHAEGARKQVNDKYQTKIAAPTATFANCCNVGH